MVSQSSPPTAISDVSTGQWPPCLVGTLVACVGPSSGWCTALVAPTPSLPAVTINSELGSLFCFNRGDEVAPGGGGTYVLQGWEDLPGCPLTAHGGACWCGWGGCTAPLEAFAGDRSVCPDVVVLSSLRPLVRQRTATPTCSGRRGSGGHSRAGTRRPHVSPQTSGFLHVSWGH